MPKSECVDLQETDVRGPRGSLKTLKVGAKFCWITPELQEFRTARAAAERMIKDYGAGPFITRVTARDAILTFKDKNGNVQRITKEYFTTYE